MPLVERRLCFTQVSSRSGMAATLRDFRLGGDEMKIGGQVKMLAGDPPPSKQFEINDKTLTRNSGSLMTHTCSIHNYSTEPWNHRWTGFHLGPPIRIKIKRNRETLDRTIEQEISNQVSYVPTGLGTFLFTCIHLYVGTCGCWC